MENQENQQEPATNKTSPALWVSIILIIIVLAVGAYFLFIKDDTTNTNNANTTVNTNTTINENVNEVSNTNIETNTNVVTNTNTTTNTNMDTSGWGTYTSSTQGFKIHYPSKWNIEEIDNSENTEHDPYPNPLRYTTITNSETGSILRLGVRNPNDNFTITPLTLFYADHPPGEYEYGKDIEIGNDLVNAVIFLKDGIITEWYLGDYATLESPVIIDGQELFVSFIGKEQADLSDEISTIRSILETLVL